MTRSPAILVVFALAALAVPSRGNAVEVLPRWVAGGPEGGWVKDLVFARSDPDRVLALVVGDFYLGRPPVGHVFLSTDAGSSWQVTGSAAVSPACEAVTVDPLSAGRLYASFWHEGVHRSDDGGRTWSEARSGLPTETPWSSRYRPVRALAASRDRPGTVLAVTDNGRVSVSHTFGAHWVDVLLVDADSLLELSPGPAETAYVGGAHSTGLLRSTDGGDSWEQVSALETVAVSCAAFDPADPDRLWVGAAGVHLSTDGGLTWTLHTQGLDDPDEPGSTTQVTSLAVDWGDPSRLVAAAGAWTFLSRDGGLTWAPIPEPVDPPCWTDYPLVSRPAAPSRFLAGTGGAGVVRLEGSSWVASRAGLFAGTAALLLVDPQRPEVAYTATGTWYESLPGLHRTTDGGRTWHELTAELGSHGVRAVAMDPTDGRHLLVATYAGEGLVASTDAGNSWSLVDLPGDDPGAVWPLLFAPSDPLRAYAFRYNELLGSTDGGWTWQVLVEDGSGQPEAQAAAVDPTDADVLYAPFCAPSAPFWECWGLQRSTDGGQTWSSASHGLPTGPNPCDPVYCPDDLVSVAVDPNHPVRVLAVTATWGLYISEDSGDSWHASTAPVVAGGVALVRDRPDTILVGGRDGGGVFISEDAGQTWQPLGAWLDPAPRVLALAASPDGALVYAGTSTSVLHLQRWPAPRRPRGRLGAEPP